MSLHRSCVGGKPLFREFDFQLLRGFLNSRPHELLRALALIHPLDRARVAPRFAGKSEHLLSRELHAQYVLYVQDAVKNFLC